MKFFFRSLTSQLTWLALVAASFSSSAWAVPVPLEFAKSEAGPYHNLAIDQSTGMYYQRQGFDGEQNVRVYANHADFIANSTSGSITLAPNGPRGFYSAVEDGKLLGRSTRGTTDFARWDLTTGVMEASTAVNGFEPQNNTGTFSYAGYSALNPMSNASGTYISSKDSSTNEWRVETMDADLNHTLVGHADVDRPGFGFMIGDFMFFGDGFQSNSISRRYDVANDVTSTVDFDFVMPVGVTGSRFWTHAIYDSTTDHLLAYDVNTRDYYRIAGAAGVFGVTTGVPEPGTLAIFGLGLVALGFTRTRRHRVF